MYTITHEIQQQKAQVIAMNLPSPAIGPQALDPKKPTIPSKIGISTLTFGSSLLFLMIRWQRFGFT